MKFFCVCENCGSTEFVELSSSSQANGLDRDGEMIVKNAMELEEYETFKREKRGRQFLCTNCENRLLPILFKDVPKAQRRKIFLMENKERIIWIKGFIIGKKIVGTDNNYVSTNE